jgi:parallel beta-helix repeat protein
MVVGSPWGMGYNCRYCRNASHFVGIIVAKNSCNTRMKNINIIITVVIIVFIVLFLKIYIDTFPTEATFPKNITIEHIEDINTSTGEKIAFKINVSPPSDSIKYRATNIPGSYLDTNGIFTWTPSRDQYGNFLIEIIATNGDAVATESVSIYVEHTNTPPVFHIPQSVAFIAGEPFEMRLNATDPDGDEIRYQTNVYPPGAAFDIETNTFKWTPDSEQYGEGSFVFSAYDGWNITKATVYYVLYNQKMLDYKPPRTLENVLNIGVFDDNLTEISGRPYHAYSQDELDKAIENAVSGDTIVVHSGTYNGNMVITESIVLIGEGNPVIDAYRDGFGVALATGGISVSGFTLINASTDGIKTYSSRNRIFNNNIIGNNYGINMMYSANNNAVYNNSIFNNTIGIYGNNLLYLTDIRNNLVANNADGGIIIEKSTNITIRKNTIAFNGGNGIMINFSHESKINENIVESNKMNGIFVTNGAKDIIENNKISTNEMNGLMIDTSLDPDLRGDQIETFSQSEYLNIIRGNEIIRNRRAGILMQKLTASISENIFKYNDYGLMILESAVRADSNTGMGNDAGFFIINSNSCVFTKNTLTQNDIGIYIVGDSNKNIIRMNNLGDNDEYGISFETHTRENRAYENEAIGNGIEEIHDEGNNI